MIKMLLKNALPCPIFNCDVCGNMIGVVSEGAAIYVPPEESNENAKLPVLHVHKDRCLDLLHELFDDEFKTQPLGAHLYLLCASTEVDPSHLERLKRLHGRHAA